MSTKPDMLQIRLSVVVNLRMAMRFLEMTERVVSYDLPWAEELTLRMLQAHYARRIRRVLALMPAKMSAASEPTVWPVIGFTRN